MSICQKISYETYPVHRFYGGRHTMPAYTRGSKLVHEEIELCARDAKALEQKIAGFSHRFDNVTRLGKPTQPSGLSDRFWAWVKSF